MRTGQLTRARRGLAEGRGWGDYAGGLNPGRFSGYPARSARSGRIFTHHKSFRSSQSENEYAVTRRQADHVRVAGQLTINTLTLQHRIPNDWAADPWAEVRPLVDGVDVLKEVHPEGMAPGCRHWTGPAESWPLAVTEQPRRVMITEPTCTAGCCGALYVTIRREGDQVIWEGWENTSNITAVPADFRFDATQYEAELARAAADRSWEEPVDTIARLLEQTLVDSGWFERWGCVLTNVSPRREEPGMPEEFTSPEGVDVDFHHVRGPDAGTDFYRDELLLTRDQSVEEQVRRLADHILADDPRKTAHIWKHEGPPQETTRPEPRALD